MFQVPEALPITYGGDLDRFQPPGFGRAEPQLLWEFGSKPEDERSLSFSHILFFSLSTFQIHTFF